MTVDELIKALQTLPGDLRVVYDCDHTYGDIISAYQEAEWDWLPIPEPDQNGYKKALKLTGKTMVVLS